MTSEEPFDKTGIRSIVQFLKSSVPRSDVSNVEAELNKDFVLGKTKRKIQNKKRRNKKKAKCLNRNEKKKLGLYILPRDSIQYNDVLPMHELWTDYMNQILELDKPIPDCNSKNWDNFTQTMYKADFHGSMLEVTRSKCPNYVGKTGICVMDTRNTFKLVSKDNRITTIPKKECVFIMHIKNLRITLFGKHLCVRPAERSTKKVKMQKLPDI